MAMARGNRRETRTQGDQKQAVAQAMKRLRLESGSRRGRRSGEGPGVRV